MVGLCRIAVTTEDLYRLPVKNRTLKRCDECAPECTSLQEVAGCFGPLVAAVPTLIPKQRGRPGETSVWCHMKALSTLVAMLEQRETSTSSQRGQLIARVSNFSQRTQAAPLKAAPTTLFHSGMLPAERQSMSGRRLHSPTVGQPMVWTRL